jgi:hypothetical protein
MIKVMIPMYGRDSPLNKSSIKRKMIRPKLTEASPAPVSVTGLYIIRGNILRIKNYFIKNKIV